MLATSAWRWRTTPAIATCEPERTAATSSAATCCMNVAGGLRRAGPLAARRAIRAATAAKGAARRGRKAARSVPAGQHALAPAIRGGSAKGCPAPPSLDASNSTRRGVRQRAHVGRSRRVARGEHAARALAPRVVRGRTSLCLTTKISLHVAQNGWEHESGRDLRTSELVGALKAAAEPTRLRIPLLLATGEFNVKDLTQILGQSQPRLSRT